MRRAIGAFFSAFLILLNARSTTAHDPITTKVTFAREIRAILSARCTVCHAPGGSAPMPLTTYEEVRPWARAIKEQVLTRRMPVWHAARGFGAFTNDPSLTPIELAMLVSWVDGGLPAGANGAKGAKRAGARSANGAEGALTLTVPARGQRRVVQTRPRWVTGWSFEPGDPLITTAAISSDAGAIGTWAAGDDDVTLPRASATRVAGRIRVEVRRREAADYEQPFTAKRSTLRLTTHDTPPARRAWTEQVSCGVPRTGRAAELIAVRPVLDDESGARVWLERPGAPKIIIGWFRDFDSRFPRTYWLERPADLPSEARLQGDAKCELVLTLVSPR